MALTGEGIVDFVAAVNVESYAPADAGVTPEAPSELTDVAEVAAAAALGGTAAAVTEKKKGRAAFGSSV